MAIDRLNDIRQPGGGARGGGYHQQQQPQMSQYQQQPQQYNNYQRQPQGSYSSNSQASNVSSSYSSAGSNTSHDPTYQHSQEIKANIKEIVRSTDQLRGLHRRALVEISSRESAALSLQVDQMIDYTSDLIQKTRAQIKALSSIQTSDKVANQQQQKALARKLMEVAKEYQSLQQSAKKGYKENLKRQYKIAKPYASDAEIEQVVESGQAGSVFQQELLSSRVNEQRRVLQDVQNRQQDLEKIEKSIVELFNLMQDMQMLLESQQTMIDSIETHVEATAVNVEDGSNQLTKATDHAKSARKKKWICCIIFIILLIIVALVVYFQVVAPLIAAKNATNGANGSNGSSGTGTTNNGQAAASIRS